MTADGTTENAGFSIPGPDRLQRVQIVFLQKSILTALMAWPNFREDRKQQPSLG